MSEEKEWSAVDASRPQMPADAILAVPETPKPGLSSSAAWYLFRWATSAWLLVWWLAGWNRETLLATYPSLQITLPLPTIAALFLFQTLPYFGVMVGLPLAWGLLIRFLPTDRGRLKVSTFFLLLIVVLPAACAVFAYMGFFKLQYALSHMK
ncbi:MAG: hypothetical protein ACREJ2_13455 [Planctomycetota bacterium]